MSNESNVVPLISEPNIILMYDNNNKLENSNEVIKELPKGVARIKKEYLKPLPVRSIVIEQNNNQDETKVDDRDNEINKRENPSKKKGRRGQNKNRKISHSSDKINLCSNAALGKDCQFADSCRFSHDLSAFLESKEPDLGTKCVNFDLMGYCPYGYRCRYLKAHLDVNNKLVIDEQRKSEYLPSTFNIKDSTFMAKLRKNEFDLSRSDKVIKKINEEKGDGNNNVEEKFDEIKEALIINGENKEMNENKEEGLIINGEKKKMNEDVEKKEMIKEHSVSIENTSFLPDTTYQETPIRLVEKKLIDFRNKTYLAPLTTVGNLPFRRICKDFGVDITCGEMAMASNLLQGQKTEWSLVRKHKSETIFGVQLAGNKPDTLVKCADLLNQTIDYDFIDINLGCPIDAVYSKGSGSALMGATNKLGRICRGMSEVMDNSLTVKFRMGIYDSKPVAHKLIPQFQDWGCVLGTLHGRSRQQRYTKNADWDYIGQCSTIANRDHTTPFALFGNGDVLSQSDYYNHLQSQSSLSGIMIGRGALMKPWLFTEIKDRKDWDISSKERFEMLKKFCDYGLEHWGSDTQGVNHTRRFLCEWQSFLYRYIPTGLLEVLPQKINDRPPPYFGRDDLETLMMSSNAEDWVKLSEMFLGKAPDDFHFMPKHKANGFSQ